jgi:hypothetical protein
MALVSQEKREKVLKRSKSFTPVVMDQENISYSLRVFKNEIKRSSTLPLPHTRMIEVNRRNWFKTQGTRRVSHKDSSYCMS